MLVAPPAEIEKQFFIPGQKTPKGLVLFFKVLLVLFILIPPVTTGFILAAGNKFSIGSVIMFVIFWGLAFYLLRLVLWNAYGKEVITLYKDKLTYHSDFKLFTDSKQEIRRSGVNVEIIRDADPNNLTGHLKLANGENRIETVLKADLQLLSSIRKYHSFFRIFPVTNPFMRKTGHLLKRTQMKKIVLLIFMSFLVLLSGCEKQTSEPVAGIKVVTGKNRYLVNTDIDITVTNELDMPAAYFKCDNVDLSPEKFLRSLNGGWVETEYPVTCTHMGPMGFWGVIGEGALKNDTVTIINGMGLYKLRYRFVVGIDTLHVDSNEFTLYGLEL